MVTSLFTHESITTTWPKAKEAQRLAEKLITLGKKNTEASRRRALSIFYVCGLGLLLIYLSLPDPVGHKWKEDCRWDILDGIPD